ncbi:MAG TPA: hypothetical protein VJQ57_09525 [Acidimicrobiia bacterium]|nr:hypothetical protein [Acidimicrobiia bacterium]
MAIELLPDGRTLVNEYGQTFEEWAVETFEYELCEECHGDPEDHEPWVIMGNWFAHCKNVPGDVSDD